MKKIKFTSEENEINVDKVTINDIVIVKNKGNAVGTLVYYDDMWHYVL